VSSGESIREPRGPLLTLLLGGLAVGILDITDAMVFWWFRLGLTPIRILQSVAAGLFGRDAAIAGGVQTAFIGMVIHFTIALSVVTACYFLGRRIPLVRERPVLAGAIYGVGVFLFMYGVVMPLSRAGAPRWALSVPMLNNVLIHIFGVGILSALFAKRALAAGHPEASS